MKTSLLSIFVSLSLTLLSQSLLINTESYYYAETGETCSANLTVTNISGEDLDVVVIRSMEEYDITTYFCWGPICYTPSSDFSSTPITISAGESFNGFYGYVQGIPEASTFVINYCFYPEDQPLDRVCADINFTSVDLSVPDSEKLIVYPNPVKDYLNININGAYDFRLNDLTGNTVLSQSLSGNVQVDVSNFESGIYYYYIDSYSINQQVRKLVITH
tara:strand:+ start:759 stop:1412 length:654 start_codon:yes stop_codon:yes gene_type:complete